MNEYMWPFTTLSEKFKIINKNTDTWEIGIPLEEIRKRIIAHLKNAKDKGYELQTIVEELENRYIFEDIISNKTNE